MSTRAELSNLERFRPFISNRWHRNWFLRCADIAGVENSLSVSKPSQFASRVGRRLARLPLSQPLSSTRFSSDGPSCFHEFSSRITSAVRAAIVVHHIELLHSA